LLNLVFYNNYYLLVLLYLEILLFRVFLLVGFGGGLVGLVGVFIFLLVLVCMGGYSISLLISIFRGWGNDFWFEVFVF